MSELTQPPTQASTYIGLISIGDTDDLASQGSGQVHGLSAIKPNADMQCADTGASGGGEQVGLKVSGCLSSREPVMQHNGEGKGR